MNKHTHFTSASFTLQERRLCPLAGRTPAEAHDIVKANERMQKNPDVLAARQILDNAPMRRQYPALEGKRPLDRAYYQALVLDNAFENTNYADLKKKDINIYDPFHLEGRDNEEIGQWLLDNINPDFLTNIDASKDPKRLGQIYLDRIRKAEAQWNAKGVIEDDIVRRLPMERYTKMRTSIDAILTKYGIRIPQNENEMRSLGNDNLDRREYFLLLAQVWNGTITINQLEEVAEQEQLSGVLGLLQRGSGTVEKAERLYIDLSLQELGPNETLSGMGIVISPVLRTAYISAMKGEASTNGQPLLGADEGAATWEKNPEYAFMFLSEHMGELGSENQDFLKSLDYHFVMTQDEKDEYGKKPPLDEKNTRALLHIVSQKLLEDETVITKTNEKKNQLKKAVSFASKVENLGGDVWEYMKDFQSHPIGSAMAWIMAYTAVRQTFKFVSGKHKNFTNLLFGGAIVGLGVGLFQQHQYGKAWWESVGDQANKLLGREKAKNPEEQTLPNYWSRELGVNDTQSEVILATLGDQKLGPVIEWYEDMHDWKAKGSPRGERPTLPFSVDTKLKQYFGKLKSEERDERIYVVMQKFLKNRGAKVRTELTEYAASNSTITQDDQLGLSYIHDRYLDQKYYEAVLRGIVRIGTVQINGGKIIEWNPDDPDIVKIREETPDIYAVLNKMHLGYEKEIRQRHTADWDMSMVFLLEADPEILRRTGRSGTEAAGILTSMYGNIANSSFNVFAKAPGETAEKEDLFDGPEKELFDDLKGTRIVDAEKELTLAQLRDVREKIQMDWVSFLSRLPADTKAVGILETYMQNYLDDNSTESIITLMNVVEKKKYQLLIAASKKGNRLDGNKLPNLNAKDDSTWNSMIDQIFDYTWLNGATYPTVNSFYDLRTLFDSEVTQPGGVSYLNILRMFPNYEKSQFDVLDTQVKTYQEAIARLRVFPIVGPGKVLTQDQINDIESQLAQRMANRAIEAMLITHGDKKYTPDAPNKRGVTPIEQMNLKDHYDQLFTEALGNAAGINPGLKLPTTLENINNYIWNQLGPDVISATAKVGGGLKYYIWDPTAKFWTEMGIPWTTEKLKQARIMVGAGVDTASEKFNELTAAVLPVLFEFPGEFVKVTGAAGGYTLDWIDKTGKSIGNYVYDQSKDIVKSTYELYGVPEADFDDFVRIKQSIENFEHKGRNARLKVRFLGNKRVGIAQYDGIPFTSDGTVLDLSVTEFLIPGREIIKEWREQAFAEKKTSLESNATIPALEAEIGPDDETVKYDEAGLISWRANSSIYTFLSTSDNAIKRAFATWKKDIGKPGTGIDPLNR